MLSHTTNFSGTQNSWQECAVRPAGRLVPFLEWTLWR